MPPRSEALTPFTDADAGTGMVTEINTQVLSKDGRTLTATARDTSGRVVLIQLSDRQQVATSSPAASAAADAPFVAVATAWIDAWDRRDMNALAYVGAG